MTGFYYEWTFEFHNITILLFYLFNITTTATTAITTTNCVSDRFTSGDRNLGTHWTEGGVSARMSRQSTEEKSLRTLQAKTSIFWSSRQKRNHYTDWTKGLTK
jgi:hypothetical protein